MTHRHEDGNSSVITATMMRVNNPTVALAGHVEKNGSSSITDTDVFANSIGNGNGNDHSHDHDHGEISPSMEVHVALHTCPSINTNNCQLSSSPKRVHDRSRSSTISSSGALGETDISSLHEHEMQPLHVHITDVSCAEKETTDESSGGGTTLGNSPNFSPSNINDCLLHSSSHNDNDDPMTSMQTPELTAVAPPPESDCIGIIPSILSPTNGLNSNSNSSGKDGVSNSTSGTGTGTGTGPGKAKVDREVSQSSTSSAENKDPLHHHPINGTDSNNNDDDLCPKVPLSFTVDVASALDHMLDELKKDEKTKGDESPMDKNRPCVLQQTSVVHMGGSSGKSSDSDESLDGDGSQAEEKEKASVHVKSSMLVCEESLNMIAQMTAPAKQALAAPKLASASDESKKVLKTTNINGVSDTTIPSSEKDKVRKAPLISGTAAAQYEAMARKNGNAVPKTQISGKTSSPVVSKPLAPPPQLVPIGPKDAKKVPIVDGGTRVASLDEDEKAVDSATSPDVKRHEKGMDMLADIISHIPLSGAAGPSIGSQYTPGKPLQRQVQNSAHASGQEETDNDQIMVPIGQSLSVYSAIAAQAGVATHRPLPAPQPRPQGQPPQVQTQSQPQQIISEPAPVLKQTYVREIGKIRRFNAATGEFSEWEDLPCQTYGDTEPRRWCELNIDESIEIPLRRGGRLRVFPNFVADGRRSSVTHSMDRCTLYRQYFKQGNESTAEARMQVLLSSKTNRLHNGSSKKGRPGYQYDGITMMAQPLSQVPEVERLGRDLAELYRLPEKEWNIGANLVCYRHGDDHMAWNSNCDQGEVLILCIIAESQNCTRPILIRPKGHDPLQDGDEEIIVFVGQGDAYEMDGEYE